MTSEEALERLLCMAKKGCKADMCNVKYVENASDIVKKDLEILECFNKIDKKELKDFIETQIKYTLNENSWLSACNCDLEKEKPTEYLIKLKEWLENDI